MRLDNARLRFSPTDLNGFLACAHLTALDVAVALGETRKPSRHSAHAELIRRKGDEHEARYLAQLQAEGREVATIANDWDLDVAARATEEAMRAGAEVIYQA